MEFKFDNNVDSDNEIPTCIFVMLQVSKSILAKMTKNAWKALLSEFIMSLYFESYVFKTNKIYRLFQSLILPNLYCLVEINAFLFLASISRKKASMTSRRKSQMLVYLYVQ